MDFWACFSTSTWSSDSSSCFSNSSAVSAFSFGTREEVAGAVCTICWASSPSLGSFKGADSSTASGRSPFGLEAIDVVAKPLAGFEAGFFFFFPPAIRSFFWWISRKCMTRGDMQDASIKKKFHKRRQPWSTSNFSYRPEKSTTFATTLVCLEAVQVMRAYSKLQND